MRFRVGGDGYESPIDEGEDEGEPSGTVRETFDVFFNVSFGGLTGEWAAKGLAANAPAGNGGDGTDGQTAEGRDREQAPSTAAGWKAKFLETQRRLWEMEEEARDLKEKVLEAVL